MEFVTQISYEDNEKWIAKAYNKLLKHFLQEQISKIFIDNNNSTLIAEPSLENLQKVLFVITLGEKEHELSCSIAYKTKVWERPIRIKRNKKEFKKALKIALMRHESLNGGQNA